MCILRDFLFQVKSLKRIILDIQASRHRVLKVSLLEIFYFYGVQLAIGGRGHVTHMKGCTVHNQNKNNSPKSETNTEWCRLGII